jgi:tetratricopeptide (TPR) repeat protein
MVVRLPSRLSAVSVVSRMSDTPFPPRGFVAIENHAVGNGDTFGLYWPIGMEDQEPLVVEVLHDESAIIPAFSSLDAFLKNTHSLDEAEHTYCPSLDDDEHSPYACFGASREAVASGDVEEACALLRRAVARLPEYTAALSLLSAQSLRLGEYDEACRCAVRALRSPPSLGQGVDLKKTWNWISRQTHGPDDLAEDPIWLNRTALAAPPAGGSKQNDVYPVLAEAAEGYAARGDISAALSLWQAYGELMWGETISFQERYGFAVATHNERQRTLEARLATGSRDVVL